VGFTPQIIHGLIGFCIIFTIHFGVKLPILGNTHIAAQRTKQYKSTKYYRTYTLKNVAYCIDVKNPTTNRKLICSIPISVNSKNKSYMAVVVGGTSMTLDIERYPRQLLLATHYFFQKHHSTWKKKHRLRPYLVQAW